MEHFYCVSFYEGDVDWVPAASEGRYRVYAKAPVGSSALDPSRLRRTPNVGFNIHSYLSFIVEEYENLPDVVVFCKNNVFPRHVSEDVFRKLARRTVFTPIEEPRRWERLGYPMSFRSSDNGYLELNDSHYVRHYEWKYFGSFDAFYRFVFKDPDPPRYLRFAPGANYVVPRANILLRSRAFYANLLTFVSHSPRSVESHMAERALMSIWTSTVAESEAMSHPLPTVALDTLTASAPREKAIGSTLGLFHLRRKANAFAHSLIEKVIPIGR